MKTKEGLNSLKEEVEALNKKLSELTEDELEQVSGGSFRSVSSTTMSSAPTAIIISKLKTILSSADC